MPSIKPTYLPFFARGGDLPLFNRPTPEPDESRQRQYDKALAALELRRAAGAMTKDGYNLELANLNADYPDCLPEAGDRNATD